MALTPGYGASGVGLQRVFYAAALLLAAALLAATSPAAHAEEPMIVFVDTAGVDEAKAVAPGLLAGRLYGSSCGEAALIYPMGGEPLVVADAAAYAAAPGAVVGSYGGAPAVLVTGEGSARIIVVNGTGDGLRVRGAFTAVASAGGAVYAAGYVEMGKKLFGDWYTKRRGLLVVKLEPSTGRVAEAVLLQVAGAKGRFAEAEASGIVVDGDRVYVAGSVGLPRRGFVAMLDGLGSIGYAVLLDAGRYETEVLAATASPSGGVVVAGSVGSLTAGTSSAAFAAELGPGGRPVWSSVFLHSNQRDRLDRGVGVAPLGGGYLVLVDAAVPAHGGSAGVLLRLDARGEQLGYTVVKTRFIAVEGLAVDKGLAWVALQGSPRGARGTLAAGVAVLPLGMGNATLESSGGDRVRVTVFPGAAWARETGRLDVAATNATLDPVNVSPAVVENPRLLGCDARVIELREATGAAAGTAARTTAAASPAGSQQPAAPPATGTAGGPAAGTPSARTVASTEGAESPATGTGAEAGEAAASGPPVPAAALMGLVIAAVVVLAAAALRRR